MMQINYCEQRVLGFDVRENELPRSFGWLNAISNCDSIGSLEFTVGQVRYCTSLCPAPPKLPLDSLALHLSHYAGLHRATTLAAPLFSAEADKS